MDAVYRLFDVKGQCYELRGSTESSCETLIRKARKWREDIVDICGVDHQGETRAKKSERVETKYLKKNDVFTMIPITIEVNQKTIMDRMQRLCKGLAELQESQEVMVDESEGDAVVELVEVPEEVESIEEDEEMRPIVEIRVITALSPSENYSTLFE